MHTLLAGTQQHLGVRFGVVQPDVEWGSSGALIERGEELVSESVINTVTVDRYDKALYAMLLYIFQKLYLLNQANEFRYMYSYEINNNQVLSSALTNYEEKNSSRVAIIPLYRNDFVYVSNNQNSDNNFSTLTNFCAELLSNTNLINAVLELLGILTYLI